MTTSQSQNEIEVNYIPLAWLDASINEEYNRTLREQIRENFGRCRFLQNIEQYHDFIQTSFSDAKYVLIISGQLGSTLKDEFQAEPKISNVYIYCNNVRLHQQWSYDYSKVIPLIIYLIFRIE